MIRLVIGISWLAAGLAAADARAAEITLTLDDALALATKANPDVLTAGVEVRAAQANVEGADLVPFNPTLQFSAGPRFSPDNARLDGNLQVTQEVEIAGQRALRVVGARRSLAAAEARARARAASIAGEVREAFTAALAAERRLQLAAEARTLAQESLAVALERVAAGKATRLESNTARAEFGAATRAVKEAEIALATARAGLRLLLALPADTTLRLAGVLEHPALSPLDPATAVAEARSARAELVEAREELAAAGSARELADAQGRPNLTVGLGVSRDEGEIIVQAIAGLPLPIFDTNQPSRALAMTRLEQAELDLRAAELRIEHEVRLAIDRLAAATDALGVFDAEAVAALEENLGLANESYRAGKMDLLQLVAVRREALAGRRALVDALEERARAEAALGRALGRVAP